MRLLTPRGVMFSGFLVGFILQNGLSVALLCNNKCLHEYGRRSCFDA